MKKALIFYLFAFCLLVFNACRKDEVSSNPNIIEAPQGVDPEGDIIMENYTLANVSNIEQAHEALSWALSKAIMNSDGFRHLLAASLDGHDKSFNEVMICKIRSELLENGISVENLLNSYLNELPSFSDVGNPLQIILNYDKLVMTKISDFHFGTQWDEQNEILPVVCNKPMGIGYSMFFGGQKAQSNEYDGKNVYSFIVLSSPSKYLINKSTGIDIKGISFREITGFDFAECPNIHSFIQNEPDYCGQPNFILIDIYEIQNMYFNNCLSGPGGPDGPPDPGDPEFPDCPRANWEKNYNSFEGLWLNDLATFNLIDNQPCAGGEQEFSFIFSWAHGAFGSGGVTHPKQVNCTRNQILNPGIIEYRTICVWRDQWGNCKWRAKIPVAYIVHPYPEYKDIHFPLFSDKNGSLNSWESDEEGRYVKLALVEYDSENCTSSTTHSESHSFSLSSQFGKKDKATGSIGWTSSFQHSWTETRSTFGPTVPLQEAWFEFCDEYENSTSYQYPNIIGFTGSVNIHLYAPRR